MRPKIEEPLENGLEEYANKYGYASKAGVVRYAIRRLLMNEPDKKLLRPIGGGVTAQLSAESATEEGFGPEDITFKPPDVAGTPLSEVDWPQDEKQELADDFEEWDMDEIYVKNPDATESELYIPTFLRREKLREELL